MEKFARLNRLPPYVFATVDAMKMEARRKGEDIVDLGMGNPDLSTPKHIVDKNGHILPYVHFEGGKMKITRQAMEQINQIAKERKLNE